MADCTCIDAIADPIGLRFCEPCHRYWIGERLLPSVTQVIRSCMPHYDGIPEDVLENARDRGVEVDRLFCGWLNGESVVQDARQDALEIVVRLCQWWNTNLDTVIAPNDVPTVFTQHPLTDGDIAGTADILISSGWSSQPWVIDIKCTSKLLIDHVIQLGAYADMSGEGDGLRIGLLHAPKSGKVKLVEINRERAVEVWRQVRRCWELQSRAVKEFAA